jgi:RNA recognition motif-containing protein
MARGRKETEGEEKGHDGRENEPDTFDDTRREKIDSLIAVDRELELAQKELEGLDANSILVNNLGPEVSEHTLRSILQNKYPSMTSAKVLSGSSKGMCAGFGIVRFKSKEEQQQALAEMQGMYCGNRPMRLSAASTKASTPSKQNAKRFVFANQGVGDFIQRQSSIQAPQTAPENDLIIK